jgi:hypothetical protein
MSSNRRDFLRKAAVGAAGVTLGGSAMGMSAKKKLFKDYWSQRPAASGLYGLRASGGGLLQCGKR